MAKRPANTTARINRQYGRGRWAEAIAGGLLVVTMAALFGFVQPRPDPLPETPAEWAAYADFSQDMPAISTAERIGQVTARATAEDVLQVLGATQDEADSAISAIREEGFTGKKRIPAGVALTAHFDEGANDGAGQLVSVSLRPDALTTLLATRRPDGTFMTSRLTARVFSSSRRIAGAIETTLADAIVAQGGDASHAAELAALFPDDAQLAIGGMPGERFDIVFEAAEDERGNLLEKGHLLFAAFNGTQSNGSWYRYSPSDTGRAEFYNPEGATQTPLLTRYPIGYTQINSGFGRRMHPVSGLLHLHSGVDFRAPMGTPIYAAGDGIISRMGWGEGYGRQIRLTHKRGYETVYAHMSAYNEKLSPGMRVKRGDLIGYVGNSGTATGPHLHFEIREDGRVVNPMTLDLPSGRSLAATPEEMGKLLEQMAGIDAKRGAIGPVASARLTSFSTQINP